MKFIKLTSGKADLPIKVIDCSSKNLLQDCYKAINCDCIEIVRIRIPELSYLSLLLIVDEDGLHKEKPINLLASLYYQGFAEGAFIVGDALIGKYGLVNGECDIVGLEENELEKVLQILTAKKVELTQLLKKRGLK